MKNINCVATNEKGEFTVNTKKRRRKERQLRSRLADKPKSTMCRLVQLMGKSIGIQTGKFPIKNKSRLGFAPTGIQSAMNQILHEA